jgi:CubicO group peptidase (beta-lactamase class C family)
VVESQLRRLGKDDAVVAVVVGDSVTFLQAFGHIPGSDAPLPDTARYQAPAAMALVNALAAARLAQDGELDPYAPVFRWTPDVPAPHDSVTVAQLLTHTAGLTAVPAMAGRTGADVLGEQIHYLHRHDRLAEPGAIYSRSGPGVALAGWVMGRAHGASYPETLDDAVFRPLGMARTSARHSGATLLMRRVVRPDATPSPELRAPRYEPVPPESALAGPVRRLYTTAPDRAYRSGRARRYGAQARVRPAGAGRGVAPRCVPRRAPRRSLSAPVPPGPGRRWPPLHLAAGPGVAPRQPSLTPTQVP